MQANLPDINSAYIKYRNAAFTHLDSGNYQLCYAALHNLNAMLEDPYRVKIDSELYREKIKQEIFYKCQFCDEETVKRAVQIYEIMIPLVERLITKSAKQQVWLCTKCDKENDLKKTEVIKEVLPNPVFFTVVPECPQRTNDLMSRTAYHVAFTKWAVNFLGEIENGMKRYRSDYKANSDEAYEGEIDIDDKDYD